MLRKGLVLFLVLACVVSSFSACKKQNDDDGKTVVTIVFNEKLENLEQYIEAKLSDVDLQWENLATTSLTGAIQRRLKAGHGPDLVISTQPADQNTIAYVLPLDGYDFSSRYESTMLKNLSVEERLYYLPLPGQYNCFVINKTLFEEAEIPLPSTNEELISALTQMKKAQTCLTDTGHVFGLRESSNVTLGTFLVGCMIPDFLGTAEGVQWLNDFENKQTVMAGTWEPAFSLSEKLLENDLMNVTPYSKQGNAVNNAIYMSQGKLAAAYGSSAFLAECEALNKKAVSDGTSRAYQYEMLPFLGVDGASDWTLTLPASYIGINAALKEEGNEKKLDACRRVLDALSSQEGQEALMKDLRLDNSYLKEFDTEKWTVPAGLEKVVEKGYVYYAKFPGKVIEYLGAQSAKFLGGKKSAAECLAAVDDYYLNGSEDVEKDLSVVGTLEEDLIYQNYNARLEETALGNLVADSIAAYTGAPIAVANGGGIRASLYKGDVIGEDLTAVCPYDNQLVVVKMPGSVLWEMLENSVSALINNEGIPGGRFLQVSGIHYTFDSDKPAGNRLREVTLEDGTLIDKAASYTVAITDYMAGSKGYLEGNGDGYTMLNLYSDTEPKAQDVQLVREKAGTFRDALRYYFTQEQNSSVSAKAEGRIVDVNKD